MPRGKLNEVHVKRTAVEWLAKDYQNTLGTNVIVSGFEAWVSKKSGLGSGRVDGLIAAQLPNGTIYTVSIEAKSERTWNDINVQHLYEKMLARAAIFAGLITILLLILGITRTQELLLGIIFPMVGITIAGFCLINFSPLGTQYRETEVVKQAKRYPANEKWVALSSDVYNKLGRVNQSNHFEKICLRNGIGLIKVTSSTKSVVIIAPKSISTPKNLDSFLTCYSRSQVVRDKLAIILRDPNTISAPLLLDEPQRSSEELSADEVAESIINVGIEKEIAL